MTKVRAGTLVHQTHGLVRRGEGIDQLNHVLVPETAPEQLDLADGREVHPLLGPFGLDLFNGHLPAGALVLGLLDDTPRTLSEGLDYGVVVHCVGGRGREWLDG